jgi:hypothetical protein
MLPLRLGGSGGVSLVVLLRFLCSLTVYNVSVVHDATATTVRMLEYIDVMERLVCIVLRVDPLCVYIFFR